MAAKEAKAAKEKKELRPVLSERDDVLPAFLLPLVGEEPTVLL